jgi:hypothetical protein
VQYDGIVSEELVERDPEFFAFDLEFFQAVMS